MRPMLQDLRLAPMAAMAMGNPRVGEGSTNGGSFHIYSSEKHGRGCPPSYTLLYKP